MSSALWRAGCKTPRALWLLQVAESKNRRHKGGLGSWSPQLQEEVKRQGGEPCRTWVCAWELWGWAGGEAKRWLRKRYPHPDPWDLRMLHYVAKQGHYSCDYIRLLRWGEYPELSRWILNAITSALF